ncbi:hypothetical protein ACTL6P_02370 [Endozoicomonas acroporae]|uniref:hypothetical protein n=1 Tax=Endozoicomonas acroporae TaxID=1701104 RepID=UPI000C77FED7|nr:hypothetical protein [Endozoicomonas acroporae]
MPIPWADRAVPPPTGNGTPANHGSQRQNRKRSEAGYQVEQTTSAVNILTKHQQPPEQPFAPPIKLRRVHDGRRMVEQPAQEPMESEPVITACTESLPVAVFVPPPETTPPTSGNILSTTSETAPAPDNIEPMEDEEPAEIPAEVLSKFLPEHQEALREHLINENLEARDDLKIIVQNAEKLLKLLGERKIELSKNRSKPPFPTLFAKLKALSITKTPELFSTYFAKASVFFSAVNTNQIKNTGCLTSMLNLKYQIKGFTEQSEEVIRFIASQPFLKQIASMRNGKGFPSRKEVEIFLSIPCLKQGWQPGRDEAVQGKPIDRELLIHISSMHNGKGFPRKEQVAAFMTMPCLKEGWQPGRDEAVQDKPVDRVLLMHIASMNSTRGLPTREQVAAFMTMPCLKEDWQPGCDEAVQDKPIDRVLLMHIASMNHCKGFPTREQVAAFMSMPCLKEDWQPGRDEAVQDKPIDRELIKRIASINSCKGFPTKLQVAAFMTIPCLRKGWQPGRDEDVLGKPIDRALLMHIASMNSGKGFPERGQVKAFMTMPCLKQDWQPGNDVAVQDNLIDRDLLVRIASMYSCKGFPERGQVKVFMTMPCLKQDWQPGNDVAVQDNLIDRDLLVRIASMYSCKGFPTKLQVAAFMTIPCLRQGWQQGSDEDVQGKPIDWALLMHIASMNSGKGFPAEAHTSAFIRWLPRENKKHCLKIASRVFAGSGLPEPRLLTANERALRRYLPDLPEYSIDSDDDFSDSDNEPDHERAEDQQMKVLALFCSAPNKWRMNVAEFEQYLTSCTNARQNDRSQVLSALASLLPMLFNHGGAGVRFWLSRHNEDQQDRRLLTKALSIPAPLDTVRFALTQLPESECLTYIVLCRNLSPAPDKVQWYALKPLREQLDQQFTMARSKAMMLEILWSQPEAKRPGYGEKLDSFFDIVFEIVPTIRQLYRIHQAFGPKKMQGFLDACIARRANTAETLMVKAQELLMEGLLLAHHYLNDYEHIPDLCFSSQVASRNGKGVVINGDAAMPGNKRLWNFITAMLIELEQTPEYKFEKQQLTVLCGRLSDSGSIVLPKPEFSLAGSGFVINNWSLEQVQTFFTATEFTERWYKKPRDPREPCVVRLDERLARMRARASETEKNGNPKATNQKAANQKRVPPSVILSVIKSGLPLNLVVWTSLDYYAKNGQLTDKLCQALAPVIEQQAAIAPDSVKNAVSARLTEIDARNMADQATITQPLSLIPPPPVTDNSLHRPQVTLATAMATLDHFQVLGEAELEILQPYRDQMTPIQLASVIDKMCHRIDAVTLLDWHTTYEKKRKDPLGLNELISWSDDDRSDWLADILEYPAMTLMNR